MSRVSFASLALCAATYAAASAQDCDVDIDKELWIRDLSVLDDPVRTVYQYGSTNPSQGCWTFGRLMENMAGPHDPSDFVLTLFKEFASVQVVNGFAIDPRPFMLQEVIEPWIAASEANGVKGLDFTIAPFVLTGIVNRMDLRAVPGYGGVGSAGEGRIVFTVLGAGGFATRMTLILEYELLAETCEDVLEWAKLWHELGSLDFGPDYNKLLEKIVDRFAGKNVAPGRPNGSAIRQVRTNELVGEFPWQWREFHLSALTGYLEQGTVAQTPQTILNRSKLIRDYVNANEADILAGTHVVPPIFAGQNFLGGSSDGDDPNLVTGHFRAKGILNNDARHLFSLNTCVACHTEETGTDFFHAFRGGGVGTPTFLSGFLTGTSLPDPVDPSTTRSFNDLKRRWVDFCELLNSDCTKLAEEQKMNRVH